MIEEIINEYEQSSAFQKIKSEIPNSQLGNVNELFIGGLILSTVTFIIIPFTSNVYWIPITLIPSATMMFKAIKQRDVLIKNALEKSGLKILSIAIGYKIIDQKRLELILIKHGCTSIKSIRILQKEIIAMAADSRKQINVYNLVPLSVIVTLFIFVITQLIKNVTLTQQLTRLIFGLLSCVFVIYFVTQNFISGQYDYYLNKNYRTLKDISFLLGKIILEKQIDKS